MNSNQQELDNFFPELQKKYSDLLAHINTLEGANPGLKSYAIMNLDQGIMWIREIFAAVINDKAQAAVAKAAKKSKVKKDKKKKKKNK